VSDVRSRTASFFDLYGQGQVSADEIHTFVDTWHASGDAEDSPLSEFLGMTQDEYAVWVMDARSLPLILGARRTNEPLNDAVARYLTQMRTTANALDSSPISSLSHWVSRRTAE
jgi:hypothetical protein